MNDYQRQAARAARDDALVDYIDTYLAKHRYAPSHREIATVFRLSSTSSVATWLNRLRAAKRVDWRDGDSRTIHTTTESTNDERPISFRPPEQDGHGYATELSTSCPCGNTELHRHI